MAVSESGLINLLVYLIIIVIFLVVLFWILDRFLVISGGILMMDASGEITPTFCNDITYPDQASRPHGEIICKLV